MFHSCSRRRVRLPGSATVGVAPLDSAEPGVAEQGIDEAVSSRCLVYVGPVGIIRIPARCNVLDPESVSAVYANGKPRVQAADIFRSRLGAASATYIIRTSCHVEHGPIAEDESECKEPLRVDTIVVVALTHSGGSAGRAVADAAEDRAL